MTKTQTPDQLAADTTPYAKMTTRERLMLAQVRAIGFGTARAEQTGGGCTTLVVPLDNGMLVDWKDDGGWVYGVQDEYGDWIELGTGAVRPSRVVGKTRALAQRYG